MSCPSFRSFAPSLLPVPPVPPVPPTLLTSSLLSLLSLASLPVPSCPFLSLAFPSFPALSLPPYPPIYDCTGAVRVAPPVHRPRLPRPARAPRGRARARPRGQVGAPPMAQRVHGYDEKSLYTIQFSADATHMYTEKCNALHRPAEISYSKCSELCRTYTEK